MTPDPSLLVINAGSSSLKFARFEVGGGLRRTLTGWFDGIGLPSGTLEIRGPAIADVSLAIVAAGSAGLDHATAVDALLDWFAEQRIGWDAVGHRIVHGGPHYAEPQRVTPEMVADLRSVSDFDPEHLPAALSLTEVIGRRGPNVPQVACFDTAFHHDLPRVARVLPIPRRFEAMGVRRYGFHGLSYAYLMGELARVGGADAARGRVVLAHLGSGASLTATRGGRPIDTTMGFTPASGVPMSTRSGDIDPGLAAFLLRKEGMDAARFTQMVNTESGLLGVSETSPDMRTLLAAEARSREDPDADEVAEATVTSLSRVVPAAVPGIALLSGGQAGPVASARLKAMNLRSRGRLPWALSFSFGRALQHPALDIWHGDPRNVARAQAALVLRARCNQAARRGEDG